MYKVSSIEEWEETKQKILREIKESKKLYPTEVVDTSSFIIEQLIEWEEFAIEAYLMKIEIQLFYECLSIFFSSDSDVSDRVYSTSREIIKLNYDDILKFLENVWELSKIENFPFHLEIRKDKTGLLIPIEVNPMRFWGWCTTADETYHAYGINSYEYYLSWKKVLKINK